MLKLKRWPCDTVSIITELDCCCLLWIQRLGLYRHSTTAYSFHPDLPDHTPAKPLLYLLLWPQLIGVSALLLPAVRRSRWQSCVALSADHLLAVVLAGKGFQRGLDDT